MKNIAEAIAAMIILGIGLTLTLPAFGDLVLSGGSSLASTQSSSCESSPASCALFAIVFF